VGTPFAFKMSRAGLFAGKRASLQPLDLKEHNCVSCHARHEGEGVRSIASLYAGEGQRPGLASSNLSAQERGTMAWTEKTYTWGLLQGLWESKPGK
jgi:hypothetical protein